MEDAIQPFYAQHPFSRTQHARRDDHVLLAHKPGYINTRYLLLYTRLECRCDTLLQSSPRNAIGRIARVTFLSLETTGSGPPPRARSKRVQPIPTEKKQNCLKTTNHREHTPRTPRKQKKKRHQNVEPVCKRHDTPSTGHCCTILRRSSSSLCLTLNRNPGSASRTLSSLGSSPPPTPAAGTPSSSCLAIFSATSTPCLASSVTSDQNVRENSASVVALTTTY